MTRRRVTWLATLMVLAFLAATGTACAAEKWGPFRGRVVDKETGRAIAGAVVLVYWEEEVGSFHSQMRFYDAREELTGPDGTFEIPRHQPSRFFTFRIGEPQFLIFAPGYVLDRWVVTLPKSELFIAPTVVEMRHLKTPEERKVVFLRAGGPTHIPAEKRCMLTRVMNQEARNLGFGSLPECGQ